MTAISDVSADWTLISVTYNSAAQLRSAWAKADVGSARWIVVDNASADDSVAVARELGAEVVRLPDNIGFGAANNVALRDVDTTWVGFVNPDLTVASAADLARLSAISTANGGALVAPQLVNADRTEQPNARGLPYLIDKIANRSIRLPGARLEDYTRTGLTGPTYVAWVIGAAVTGPTATLRRLDGWDERFFVYYEDHDLGLRAWANGIPVVVDPTVRWEHAWQRATTRPSLTPWKHELRSARRFYGTYPELLGRRRGALAVPDGPSACQDRLWSPAVQPDDSTHGWRV